jgi:hypothetical protein
MSDIGQLRQRALEVITHLPPGSFTFDEFLAHATGLNVIDSTRDVGPMLKYLTEHELIRRVDSPAGQPSRWARCDVAPSATPTDRAERN